MQKSKLHPENALKKDANSCITPRCKIWKSRCGVQNRLLNYLCNTAEVQLIFSITLIVYTKALLHREGISDHIFPQSFVVKAQAVGLAPALKPQGAGKVCKNLKINKTENNVHILFRLPDLLCVSNLRGPIQSCGIISQ